MRRNNILPFLFVLVLGFFLIGCENGEETVTTLPREEQEILENAAAKVIISDADNLTTDFLLPSSVWGTTVTWVCDHPEILTIAGNTSSVDGYDAYQVLLYPPTTVDTTAVLTGTFSYQGYTLQADYTVRVKAEVGLTSYLTIEALHSTAVLNDLVQVKGYVYSIYKNGYFIIDASGVAVGIYTTEKNQALVAIGDEVSVKGIYSSYNSLFQIKDLTKQSILSHQNATAVAKTVLTNPADLKTLNSADKTIHGKIYTVKVTPKEVVSGSYTNLYLYVGETQIAQVYYNSDADSLAVLKNYLNQEITIDVLYYCYYSSSVVYVTFFGTSQDIISTPLTDEQKLAADLTNLTLPSSAISGSSLSLPSTGTNGTAISWVSDNSTLAPISGNSVTFSADIVSETITLTASLSYGTLPALTKAFSITVSGKLSLAQINALATGTLAQAEGKVYLVLQNGYFISDGTTNLAIFTSTAPTVALGDTVIVSGTVSVYGSLKQLGTITATEIVSSGTRDLPEMTLYDQSEPLLTGKLYRVTGLLKKEGSRLNYYLYDGTTKIGVIYYMSPVAALTTLDASVDSIVTLDVFFYSLKTDSNASELVTNFFAFDNFGSTLTDAQKVASDLAALNIRETGYAGKSIVLPKIGYYGTTLSYAVDKPSAVTIDSTGSSTVLTFNTATTVMITATGSLGEANQDATFDMTIQTLTLTSIPAVYAGTDGAIVFVEGIITGFDGKTGIFIQDENKNGLYIDDYFAGVSIGNKITVSAEIATIVGLDSDFRYLSGENVELIANDQIIHSVLFTAISGASLSSLYDDATRTGRAVTITDLTVAKYEEGYVYFFIKTVESTNVYLKAFVTDSWMSAIYPAASVIAEANLIVFQNDGINLLGINLVLPNLTDNQKVMLDLALVSSTLSVSTEITLPELTYGTYSNFVFSASLNGIVEYSAGIFSINRPAVGQPNATGTLTVTVTVGTNSETKVITLTVLAVPAEGNVLFTETYENPTPNKDAYAAGDVTYTSGSWNLIAGLANTVLANDKVFDVSSETFTAAGNAGKGKSIRLHPGNTNAISIDGITCAVLTTNFTVTNMTSIDFFSAMYSDKTGSLVTVQISTDNGTTWETVGTANPTGNMTKTTISLSSATTGRIRFLISGPERVNLDQVVVKGN